MCVQLFRHIPSHLSNFRQTDEDQGSKRLGEGHINTISYRSIKSVGLMDELVINLEFKSDRAW